MKKIGLVLIACAVFGLLGYAYAQGVKVNVSSGADNDSGNVAVNLDDLTGKNTSVNVSSGTGNKVSVETDEIGSKVNVVSTGEGEIKDKDEGEIEDKTEGSVEDKDEGKVNVNVDDSVSVQTTY